MVNVGTISFILSSIIFFFLLVVTDACSFFCEIKQDIPGYGKFQKRKLLNEDSIIHCPGDMTNDE